MSDEFNTGPEEIYCGDVSVTCLHCYKSAQRFTLPDEWTKSRSDDWSKSCLRRKTPDGTDIIHTMVFCSRKCHTQYLYINGVQLLGIWTAPPHS
jgi:hypothetical protein